MHLPMRLNVGHFKSQSIVEVGKTQPVKNDEPDEVSRKKKRQIEPHFLAVQLLMQPGKDVIFSKKQQEKEAKRDGEESGKGFGDVLKGLTPSRFGDVGHHREKEPSLSNCRPE
ncbi:MAG: hypothetical protein JSW15_02365 [Deltaproteobacteria bacterium]|nr:MAG: hypothetical protein JSW15_02365 [Deltaproteobacteria bacterium]